MKFIAYEFEIILPDDTKKREYVLPDFLTKEEVMMYVNSKIADDEELNGFTSYRRILYEEDEK